MLYVLLGAVALVLLGGAMLTSQYLSSEEEPAPLPGLIHGGLGLAVVVGVGVAGFQMGLSALAWLGLVLCTLALIGGGVLLGTKHLGKGELPRGAIIAHSVLGAAALAAALFFLLGR